MTGDPPLLAADDPLAVAVTGAIRDGDLARLRSLLGAHPGLAAWRIADRVGGVRSLLHVATDWPGRFPRGAATVAALVAAGADVDARFAGPHRETPLHWAASCDDVDVVDALLDAGADIEAPGSVIADGTPLANARAFGQWRAAYRLVVRGPAPPSSTRRRSVCTTGWNGPSPAAPRRRPTRSTGRSGARATAGGSPAPDTCGHAARGSTGCRRGSTAPPWTRPSGVAPPSWSAGCGRGGRHGRRAGPAPARRHRLTRHACRASRRTAPPAGGYSAAANCSLASS